MNGPRSTAPDLLYPKVDHEALGEHYLRHIDAMTREGLHAKSAIAGQLAWRDAEIARLRDAPPQAPRSADQERESQDALIAAAAKYVAAYDGDDRLHIKVDVMNAFYAGSRHAWQARAAHQEATAKSNLVLYCHECGHIGEVKPPALACCPDHAGKMVHPETAEQARAGFQALYAAPLPPSDSAAVVALRSALERVSHNFDLLLAGKPVRDAEETRAEVRAALAAKGEHHG